MFFRQAIYGCSIFNLISFSGKEFSEDFSVDSKAEKAPFASAPLYLRDLPLYDNLFQSEVSEDGKRIRAIAYPQNEDMGGVCGAYAPQTPPIHTFGWEKRMNMRFP